MALSTWVLAWAFGVTRAGSAIHLAYGLRAAAQAQVPVGRLVAALRAGRRQVPYWDAEPACRFRWVWRPSFAVLNAADPRWIAFEQQGYVPQGPAAFEPDSADPASDPGIVAGVCHGASLANASSRPRSILPGWYPSAQISAARRRAAM
jgi:hypothetical protein